MEGAIFRDWIFALISASLLLALGACESGNNEYFRAFARPGAAPSSFYVCHGYGCKHTTRVALSDDEWQSVRAILAAAPADGRSERRRVSSATARLDQLVGLRTGTLVHQRREGNGGDLTQFDCIDESINTWTYLTLLERDGLMRFHRVGELAHGGTLLSFDVRNTATLVAKSSGERFAIDPTLVDAGEPPPVVPLENWKAAWPPEIPDAER